MQYVMVLKFTQVSGIIFISNIFMFNRHSFDIMYLKNHLKAINNYEKFY